MKLTRLLPIFFIALLTVTCTPSRQAMQPNTDVTAQQQDEISDIITKMPAVDQQEQYWLNARLFEMAPASIHAITNKLVAPGTGGDTYARYAMNGLGKYVSRPGAETERSLYEQVIIAELRNNQPPAVKSFLMEQLELTGSDAAVPVLESFVGDDFLNESAVHALRAINSEQSVQTLLRGIPKTEGDQTVAVIKALGDMEASSSAVVNQIQPYANSNNSQLREAVLYTLANSGHPDAYEAVTAYGNAQHQLQYARRLNIEGYPQRGSQIARAIYDSDSAMHDRIAALNILAELDKEGSTDLIVDAAQHSNAKLRSAALELASDIHEAGITSRFVELLEQNSPSVQADIIEMLGRRGDTGAWPAVKAYLRNESQEVRIASAGSAVSLGGTDAIPTLLTSLNRAKQQTEINAIKTALLQLPSEPMYQAASQRWMSMSSQAKVTLIEIVAERQTNEYLDELLGQLSSSDQQVRLAILRSLDDMASSKDLSQLTRLFNQAKNDQETQIIQKAIISVINDASDDEDPVGPVITAMEDASPDNVVNLLEILPDIGGNKALNATVSATDNSNSNIQTAAKEALANWPDGSAIQPLQEIITSSQNTVSVSLINGYVRIVRNSMYSDSDKVAFITAVMNETTNDEQQTRLLEALSNIHAPASLRAVTGYLNDSNKSVREEALYAAAEILAPSYDFSSDFDGTDKVLAVFETMTDSTTKHKIESYINEIQTRQKDSEGFTSLFNREDLSGWIGDKDAYTVRDGTLIHRSGKSGNLFTEQEYSDFILRFQFKLTPGANNGLAIRSPLQGNPAYEAMEIQILDNTAEKYQDLEDYQYHGSIYGVEPAERGHLKPAGEWNTQEVIANGSEITVKLNGVTILKTNIEEAGTPKTLDGKDHPGLFRSSGHIGFLGHGDEVAFRNIRIRDLNVYYPDYSTGSEAGGGLNHPPEGFKALFNGENLDGWKGLVANPEKRAEMSEQELAAALEEANRVMQEHWSVRDGILYFDGKGESLTTAEDYKDFEMMVDWKIEPGGDSGVYLRGTPQVQIWDITEHPAGSGGLYNNQNHLSDPLVAADNPVGEWNHMRIKMIGDQVTVHLNGQLVVPGVVLENYWNRDKPIYSKGQIELQAHNTPLYFKNVFIREIPRTESLFNGTDLTGWERVGGNAGSWNASNGLLYTEGDGKTWEKGSGGGWLSTTEMYDNFKLELEYRLPEGGNSGIFLRAPHKDDPAFQGLEIQLLDDYSEQYSDLEAWQYTGSIYDVKAPSKRVSKRAGEWQKMIIVADGPQIKVTLNDRIIINTNLVNHLKKATEHPGLKRRKGYIGLQNHNSRVEFKNIRITEIK